MTNSRANLLFFSVLFSILSVLPISSAQSLQWMTFTRRSKTLTVTREFSEEGSGFSGRQTAPIAGIVCSGRFCDNKRLIVVRNGNSAPVQNSAHWTRWISDEEPSWADCPANMIANELQCDGRYCDNLRLQCGTLSSDYRVVTSDIKTVNWFSEEEGERLCPDGYYLWGIACRGDYCDDLKLNCARVDYKAGRPAPKNVVQDSLRFAPVYFFDGNGPEYCLPDWPSSTNNNNCRTSFLENTPSFVQYNICGMDEVYTFWLWYGDQKRCIIIFDKGHDDDWEHVSVFVRDGKVQKVTYFQHTGQYTRRRGTFEMSGERPHVYVGKVGHGSYHARCDGKCSFVDLITKGCLGSVNYCQGGCGYWDDFRNPGPKLARYNMHELKPGDKIDGISRPNRDICVKSCDGSGARLLTISGCWQNNV